MKLDWTHPDLAMGSIHYKRNEERKKKAELLKLKQNAMLGIHTYKKKIANKTTILEGIKIMDELWAR